MRKATKIFLIGFMGSGKSTIGKNLASHLGWSYIDLDENVEKMAGMSVPEIFSRKGEHFFRQIESEALRKTGSQIKAVISTGGGTPCFTDNMNFMLANGLTIYLKMPPSLLKNRLSKSPEKRPLLKNIDKKELKEFITTKLAEREKWYCMAELTVDGISTDISGLYSLIKNRIRE